LPAWEKAASILLNMFISGIFLPVKCKHGSRGRCGGIAGLPCGDGYTCKYLHGGIADALGVCCKKASGKTGFCTLK